MLRSVCVVNDTDVMVSFLQIVKHCLRNDLNCVDWDVIPRSTQLCRLLLCSHLWIMLYWFM